ncbi:transposase family protein [Burkholderia pseudomallei]|nr:transposase family protein [Burkholderia pseudomallei]
MTNTRQEVLTGPERRRRWMAEQKLAMVCESFDPGKSVSMVARQHGANPDQLFHWRKLYQDGSLSAVIRAVDGKRVLGKIDSNGDNWHGLPLLLVLMKFRYSIMAL